MSLDRQLQDMANSGKESYAATFTQSAEHLNQEGLYDMMARFAVGSTIMQQERNGHDPDEPLVHVDMGSGPAHLLGEMSKKLRESGKQSLLIGVEVNDVMAKRSVERLRSEGHTVEEHIFGKERIVKEKGRPVLRAEYFPNPAKIDALNLAPDNRIVIVRDDARGKMDVLMAILRKVRASGVRAPTSVSLTLPGVTSEIVMQDIPYAGQSHNQLLAARGGEVANAMMRNVINFTRNEMDATGIFLTVQRANIQKMYDLYEELSGQSIPEDEQARSMIAASFMLHNLAPDLFDHFKIRMLSVLVDDLNALEAGTTIDYSEFSGKSTRLEQAPRSSEPRQLIGIGVVPINEPPAVGPTEVQES